VITKEQILAIEESIGVVWPIEPDEITLMMHAAYKLGAEETIDECCKAICWKCDRPNSYGLPIRVELRSGITWVHDIPEGNTVCLAESIREHFYREEQKP